MSCHVQHGYCSQCVCVGYLKAVKKVDSESSHHKGKKVCEVMDANSTYCGKM